MKVNPFCISMKNITWFFVWHLCLFLLKILLRFNGLKFITFHVLHYFHFVLNGRSSTPPSLLKQTSPKDTYLFLKLS